MILKFVPIVSVALSEKKQISFFWLNEIYGLILLRCQRDPTRPGEGSSQGNQFICLKIGSISVPFYQSSSFTRMRMWGRVSLFAPPENLHAKKKKKTTKKTGMKQNCAGRTKWMLVSHFQLVYFIVVF